MARLWIVDRSPQRRAALARLAAASEGAVLGAPGDLCFENGSAPDVIVMALSGDWEPELQFAHSVGRSAPNARWLLVGEPSDAADALARFDTRDVEFLVFPPDASALRTRIAAETPQDSAPSLSERARREAVATRFGRWFGDLDLPDVLRALDPRLADVPVWIRGEHGSGRSVVARYIHFFGGTAGGTLAQVPCTPDTRPDDLVAAIDAWVGERPVATLTIWLENLELLPLPTQRVLLAWIESGPPGRAARARTRRWIASVTDPAPGTPPDASLRQALSGLVVALPTLRSRAESVSALVAETARVWCAARREPVRRFGEDALAVMEEYPWPGNLRELEAVVTQSLAAGAGDPVRSDQLQLEGRPFAPLNASEIGSLIEPPEPPAVPSPFEQSVETEVDALLDEIDEVAEAEPEPTPSGGGAEILALHGLEPREPAAPAAPEPEPAPASGVPTPLLDVTGGPEDGFESFDDLDFDDADELDEDLEDEPSADLADPLAALPEIEAERLADDDLVGLARALEPTRRDVDEAARVLASLIPDRFEAPDARERLARSLREAGGRLDDLATRLATVTSLADPARDKVNVAALLEDLLERRRERIRERRLLVLKELDSHQPHATGDAELLGLTLETLLGTALDWVPPHGDVYLASRHHGRGPTPGQGPTLRVLIRFHNALPGSEPTPGGAEAWPQLAIAEALVRAQGGSVGVASTDGDETVVLIDLPAL